MGGKIKFPVVPGAPADGIVCDLPGLPPSPSWPEGSTELTFTLKLDRAGATVDSVTINNALYLKGTAEDKGKALEHSLPPSSTRLLHLSSHCRVLCSSRQPPK